MSTARHPSDRFAFYRAKAGVFGHRPRFFLLTEEDRKKIEGEPPFATPCTSGLRGRLQADGETSFVFSPGDGLGAGDFHLIYVAIRGAELSALAVAALLLPFHMVD